MKQYQIGSNGDLRLKQVPIPNPKNGEVLIKVKAIGVNRADLLQREGLYPIDSKDHPPGLEISGVIESTNERVCALISSAGYSEYVVAKKEHIITIPTQLSFIEAASLPEAMATCWMTLFDMGSLKPGGSVLIHGATSGVGSFAVQVAKSYGCKVFTSVGISDKIEVAKSLNPDFVFNYRNTEFGEEIKMLGGADLVVDILGGEYLNNNLKALNKHGKIVILALMGESKSQVNLGSILLKNLTIKGATLRSQSDEAKGLYIAQATKEILPKIVSKEIRTITDSTFNFDEVEQAHQRMKSREHFGKIIITI